MSKLLTLIAAALAAMLASCSDPAPQAMPAPPSAAEIRDKIRDAIRIEGGAVLITDKLVSATYAVSPSHPWAVECGPSGLSVKFGADRELALSYATLGPEDCPAMAGAAAGAIIAIIGGR